MMGTCRGQYPRRAIVCPVQSQTELVHPLYYHLFKNALIQAESFNAMFPFVPLCHLMWGWHTPMLFESYGQLECIQCQTNSLYPLYSFCRVSYLTLYATPKIQDHSTHTAPPVKQWGGGGRKGRIWKVRKSIVNKISEYEFLLKQINETYKYKWMGRCTPLLWCSWNTCWLNLGILIKSIIKVFIRRR